MTYNELIKKLIPMVEENSTAPCIIWKNGKDWNIDELSVSELQAVDYLKEARKKDPCAITFSGNAIPIFSKSSMHGEILSWRLFADYHAIKPLHGDDMEELYALANLLDAHYTQLSQEVIEYLARCDMPLIAARDLLPVSVKSDDPRQPYNMGKVRDVVEILEYKTYEIMHRINPEATPFRDWTRIPDLPPPPLKLSLLKNELAKIGFPYAEYMPGSEKLMLQADDYRLPNINNEGDIQFGKEYRSLVLDKIRPLVNKVKEIAAAWENALPAPFEETSQYRILAEYNNIVLAARDDTIFGRGLKFVTWNYDYGRTGFNAGHYTEDYAEAKESFALRSGLIKSDKLMTREQAADIKAAIDFSLENHPSLELTGRLEEIKANLCRAYPEMLNHKDPVQEQAASKKPAKKPTFQEKLDNAKQRAAQSGAKKTGRGPKNKNQGREE